MRLGGLGSTGDGHFAIRAMSIGWESASPWGLMAHLIDRRSIKRILLCISRISPHCARFHSDCGDSNHWLLALDAFSSYGYEEQAIPVGIYMHRGMQNGKNLRKVASPSVARMALIMPCNNRFQVPQARLNSIALHLVSRGYPQPDGHLAQAI